MSNEFKYRRTVLILDISASMRGMKCHDLQLSATRLIEDTPDRDYVGIVLFDGQSNIEHRVVQITDRLVRDGLIQCLPSKVRGGNGRLDIGSGLLMALQALTQECLSTEGATLMLMTDGEDGTEGCYVDRVLPTLLAAKVRITCIAIGNRADRNLERLARETNGNIFLATGY